MSPNVLEVRDITKYYPGTVALDGVSISVLPGEVHTIAGENGAGKSTLMKILAGAISPDEGAVIVDGNTVHEYSPKEASNLGIGIIYQEFNLIPHLSVSANVMLGKEDRRGLFLQSSLIREKTKKVLDELGVRIDPDQIVADLGVAEQQLVEIAKALSQEVKILIMDEPTAALTPKEVDSLFHLIRNLKTKGVAILYISHRFDEIFTISDRVTVLRDGKYVDTCNICELDEQKLVSLMIGRELSIRQRNKRTNIDDEIVLKLKDVSFAGKVSNINFALHRGEILGFAGLLGAGRTELAHVLFGLAQIDTGTIELFGQQVTKIVSPKHAIDLGMGLIPEDRKQQGLVLTLQCEHNIVLPMVRKMSKWGFVGVGNQNKTVSYYRDKLRIKFKEEQLAKELSGGNQQKLVIAKALASQASIVIFDEPTRGVDIGAKQEIYRLMDELLDQGKSILMLSSDMNEILSMSDRVAVMREGHIVGILNRNEATQEKIMYMASGLDMGKGE